MRLEQGKGERDRIAERMVGRGWKESTAGEASRVQASLPQWLGVAVSPDIVNVVSGK